MHLDEWALTDLKQWYSKLWTGRHKSPSFQRCFIKPRSKFNGRYSDLGNKKFKNVSSDTGLGIRARKNVRLFQDRIRTCKTNRSRLCQPLGAQTVRPRLIHPIFFSTQKLTINKDSGQVACKKVFEANAFLRIVSSSFFNPASMNDQVRI